MAITSKKAARGSVAKIVRAKVLPLTKAAAPLRQAKAKASSASKAKRAVFYTAPAAAKAPSRSPRPKTFKVGELWDAEDAAFFGPYFDRLK